MGEYMMPAVRMAGISSRTFSPSLNCTSGLPSVFAIAIAVLFISLSFFRLIFVGASYFMARFHCSLIFQSRPMMGVTPNPVWLQFSARSVPRLAAPVVPGNWNCSLTGTL